MNQFTKFQGSSSQQFLRYFADKVKKKKGQNYKGL